MDLRILGQLEADMGGRPSSLGGPKQRAVLALLVASGGGRISTDALITGVYGEDAAPSAKRTIHTYVSNLRRELGELISRQGDGYRLEIAPEQLDAARFESLYRDGTAHLPDDPATAARILREALAMWRGRAYADIEGGPVVDSEKRRLEELRVAALQSRIDADLALGLHHEIIGELEALTTEYPYQERLRAQLMLALYRSDRQTDALRAYSKAGAFLAELGIEPGHELRRLEDQILQHDPALDIEVRPTIERRAILVADLADSLRSAPPSERDAALAERDRRLELGLSEHGGAVVGLRGTAVYAAIPDVASALTVAESLSSEQVQLAVDFGDVEIRDGDVSGPPLGRSARLVATAHPGQVILSEQAQQALSETGATGWSVRSLGRHRIRGIDEALMIFQATGKGLDREFPPLLLDRLPPPIPSGHPTIAGYELRDRLAEDERSVVYRGYQHSVGREVTVRVFRQDLASDPRFIRRFEAEAQRLALLDDPHVLPVLDFWREPDRAVIVSPATYGGTLADALTRPVDVDTIVTVVCHVGAALAHAHGAGVIHGMLAPAFIVFDDEHNPYLTGLGLASLTEGIVPPSMDTYSVPELLYGDMTAAGDVYSLGMITAELLSGAPLPRDRAVDRLDGPLGAVIATAIDPDPSGRYDSMRSFVGELTAAVGQAADPFLRRLTDARNPYKGLSAFTEADAGDFFGRDDLVTELLRWVDSGPVTMVVGPSGIGKSSAVRAGLIPALRSGALPGSEEWFFTDMLPGTAPFDELAAAFARISTAEPSDMVEHLRSGEMSLAKAAERLIGDETAVIVVDQFEEVFTHVDDEVERQAFLGMLTEAARSTSSLLKVVVTLRADFFDRPLEDPELGEAVRGRIVPVQAPSVAELAEAVRRPAEQVGVAVDDELVSAMADEAAGEPGGLPLLQHMLAELFDARSHDRLTLASYREAGGLVGSIGRRAERIYLELPSEARSAARDVFIRLVTVDEAAEDTRRRVRRREIEQVSRGPAAVELVLDAFGRHRLLTFDRDAASRGPTVELAHEAILRQWDRLAAWIDDARDDLLIRRRIDVAAREWDEASRDPSYLLGGARLEQAEAWQERAGWELTDTERDFLSDSRRHAADQEHRRQRTRRTAFAGLAAALVIVSALGLVAAAQRRTAQRQALENRTAELAGEALLAIDQDPDLAILLALEAHRTSGELSDVPPPEVVSALHTAVHASRLEGIIPDGRLLLSVSPDGRYVALDDADQDNKVVVYEIETGIQVAERELPAPLGELSYSPDGSRIAAGLIYEPDGSEGEGESEEYVAFLLLDPATLKTVQELATADPGSCCEDWSSDGRLLAAWSEGGTNVWETDTGALRRTLGDIDNGWGVFVPGERTLALERNGVIDFVDVTSEHVESVRTVVPPAEETPFEFSADGRSMLFPDWGGREFHVLRLDGDDPPAAFPHPSPNVAHLSPNGRSVSAGGNADAVTVVDLESGRTTALHGHGSASYAHAFASDDRLLTVSFDGGTRVWSLAPQGVAELGNVWLEGASGLSVAVGSSTLLAFDQTGPDEETAAVIDLESGARRSVARFWYEPWFDSVASPDGSLIAGLSTDADRVASVIEVATGETLLSFRPCENVEAVDALHAVALVERWCPDGSQAPLLPDARRGLVDLHTGELVMATENERQIGHAVFGRPGTPAEDLLVLHTFELIDTDAGAIPPSGDPMREVEFREASTGALLTSWPFNDDTLRGLVVMLSPDGRYAALAAQTGQAVIFDVAAILNGVPATEAATVFEDLTTGPNHRTAPMGVSFVTSGGGTQIRQWDTESGRLLADIATDPGQSAELIPLPDGSGVLYSDADGVLRRFLVDPADLVALAEARVQRGFTEAECERYFEPGECPVG